VPPLVHAPSAPLHGLPPLPPEILAADAAAADLDAGFGYAAASGGGGQACDVRRAAFTVAEARKLESLAHDGGLEPQLRAAAATQLAAVLAADGRLLRASLQASSLEAAVASVAAAAAIATTPAASAEAEEDDQTGPLLASLLLLLGSLFRGCATVRVASLRSPAALHALRRAAFARYAPARAALRRALEALLFDEADLYAAASISAEAELTVDLSAATPLSSLSPRSLHIEAWPARGERGSPRPLTLRRPCTGGARLSTRGPRAGICGRLSRPPQGRRQRRRRRQRWRRRRRRRQQLDAAVAARRCGATCPRKPRCVARRARHW